MDDAKSSGCSIAIGCCCLPFLLQGAVLLALILFMIWQAHIPPEITEITDPGSYGVFTGNYDDETPAQFIHTFFPDKIDASFSDVVYHYKAKKFDSYAYEVWLEFTIEDTNAFYAFLDTCVEQSDCIPFIYNPDYTDYTISNVFCGSSSQREHQSEERYSIEYAELGKILYNETDQRFIFWALGVFDGGGTFADELNHFFNYFDVDPVEFESHTETGY